MVQENDRDAEFFENQRQALLLAVAGIERHQGIEPLTSECRKMAKALIIVADGWPQKPGEDWHVWAKRFSAFIAEYAALCQVDDFDEELAPQFRELLERHVYRS